MRKVAFFMFIISLCLAGVVYGQSTVPINWVRKTDSPIQMNLHYAGVIGSTWYHAGGSLSDNVGQPICQAYDLESDIWFPMASMNRPHRGHGVVAYGGKLYAFGGISYFSTFHPELEVYHPDLDSWSYLSPMPVALRYFGSALSGSRIYVTGGEIAGSFEPQNSLWIYDIDSDTWSAGSSMPTTLQSHCSTAHGGKIYTFGGYDASYNAIDLVQIYDIAAGTWSNGPPMPIPVLYSSATVLDDKIYVIGGQTAVGWLSTVQIYDPGTGDWSLGTELPEAVSQAATDTYNGRLYVYSYGQTWCGTILPPNSPPVADAGGPYLTAVGQTVSLNGSGSYDNDGDSLVYLWTQDELLGTFGDPSSENPYYTGSQAGVTNLTLTVGDGQSDSSDYTLLVVYDPEGGFVTGGGWIDSPEGAYIVDPSLAGKANFGFVSKYKKDATVPTGQTEFIFQTADMNFHSSSYEWLVVTGTDYAKFKGTGTINGFTGGVFGDYKFMLWAGDGDPDTFTIRIWEEDEESGEELPVYQNPKDQPISGGSIIVHDN